MKSTWRVLLGFLLAPLITPLTFLEARWGTIAAPVLIWVGYFAYGSAVIFGGPAFLLYWMLRLKNPLWFLIGGGLIGLIVCLLLGLFLGGAMKQPVSYVVAASLSGLTFRLIAGSAPFERPQPKPKKAIDVRSLLFYYRLNTGKEVIKKYMSSNHSEVAET